MAARLAETFGPDAVQQSAQRYGNLLHRHTETGTLRMKRTGMLTKAGGTLVTKHRFYSQHTDTRD